jgi:XTP/dITP diphosphohydrolase
MIITMKKLVVATNNAHKLTEIRAIVGDDIELLTLADIHCCEEIPETADTLEGNALQKARYIYARTGLDCFADDTGLEVDALGGEPGVRSARYATDGHDDEANKRLLLERMEGVEARGAQFRTAIALIIGGKEYLFEGIVRGHITTEEKGEGGFGYDPLFVAEGYEESFAEISAEEKNAISHRGRAVRKLAEFLQGLE